MSTLINHKNPNQPFPLVIRDSNDVLDQSLFMRRFNFEIARWAEKAYWEKSAQTLFAGHGKMGKMIKIDPETDDKPG